MADEVPLPAWTWDDKLRVLVPRCPKCGSTTVVSGEFFTCHMAGFSHYHQRFADVLDLTRRRLADP